MGVPRGSYWRRKKISNPLLPTPVTVTLTNPDVRTDAYIAQHRPIIPSNWRNKSTGERRRTGRDTQEGRSHRRKEKKQSNRLRGSCSFFSINCFRSANTNPRMERWPGRSSFVRDRTPAALGSWWARCALVNMCRVPRNPILHVYPLSVPAQARVGTEWPI